MQQPKVDVLESVLDFCYRQPFLQDYKHISQEGATYKRRHANFLEYEVHFSIIVWFHGLGFTPTLKNLNTAKKRRSQCHMATHHLLRDT